MRRQPGQGPHDAAGIHFDTDQVFVETLFKLAGFAVGIGVDRILLADLVTVALVAGLAGIVVIGQHQRHAGKVQNVGFPAPVPRLPPELLQQSRRHFARVLAPVLAGQRQALGEMPAGSDFFWAGAFACAAPVGFDIGGQMSQRLVMQGFRRRHAVMADDQPAYDLRQGRQGGKRRLDSAGA